MVFSGRPSTACHTCRPARRKCDRAPNGCSQCRRKGHACPGYPDPTALRMRNETTSVTKKQSSKSKTHAARQQSPPRTQDDAPFWASSSSLEPAASSSSRQSLTSFDSPSPGSPALLLSTNQQALAFLFHTFIAATPFEGYLSSFYLPYSPDDDACALAIDATALAAYARHARQHRHHDAARANYARALSRVNTALADPRTAVQDQTLVAVLVLALFEATVFQDSGSSRSSSSSAPTSWVAHTWGAMQLLMLRGPDQLASSPVARQLFAHASNNIKASCIQRSAPIPQPFLEFDGRVRGLLDSRDLAVPLADLLHKVCAIKARARDEQERSMVLLLEALQADQEIIAFCDAPPPALSFTREPFLQGPAWTYQRIVHTYASLRLCKVWNAVRLLRIFLLSLLGDDIAHCRVDETLAESHTLSALNEYARKHMAEVASDILATVPSFVHSENGSRTFLSAGRCLGWPLGILELSTVCPPDASRYARRTLEWLAEDLNLPQAIDPERHPGSRDNW
ncbi:hypothetical protein G3M48_007848 [Beauveria asiatica]|uniref:Zn(2)-C6 fungal-type domain-containing protein n=1 Tax=Beauveria asiatica TaxID=1069075 RepID=A0AAW0RM82_9HYPO